MSSQPERRRSLCIIESRRKILRDGIRDIVDEYKRAQRRQRWRDAIWDIIQQKRAKQKRAKRMVCKLAEQRRAQKAAILRARIRERQEDRRCVVCLCYHCPSELHLQHMFRIHTVHTKFPKKVLNTTIRMWCRKARVHMACVLQSIRCMAAPTNIFGGASNVDAMSWTVETRTSSTSASTTWTRSIRKITRKSSTCTVSTNSLQNNGLGTRVNRTLTRSRS